MKNWKFEKSNFLKIEKLTNRKFEKSKIWTIKTQHVLEKKKNEKSIFFLKNRKIEILKNRKFRLENRIFWKSKNYEIRNLKMENLRKRKLKNWKFRNRKLLKLDMLKFINPKF